MGQRTSYVSPADYESTAAELFSTIPDYLPLEMDSYLLKYSGTESTSILLQYSEIIKLMAGEDFPAYVEKASRALGPFTPIPNAVGLGAFVISMVLTMALSSTKGWGDDLKPLRKVFAEEKASMVRDLIMEYLKRYEMHLHNDDWLLENSLRLESQLSTQLTILRNSILVDNQMTPRAINHWVNGAAFHTQVLLHIARLRKKTSKGSQDFESAKKVASNAVDIYSRHAKQILDKYKGHKLSQFSVRERVECGEGLCIPVCFFHEYDVQRYTALDNKFCLVPQGYYLDYVFSRSNFREMEDYFPNVQKNLEVLVNQEGTFQIKS